MALAAVIGIALAYHSPNPSYTGAFAAFGVFAVSAWMLTSAKTHVTLAVLMVYLAVADGVIKNLSGSPNATLGRDVLLYAIAIGVLLKKIHRKEPFSAPPLTGWIVAFVAVVAVQLFNPANESWSHSLASVRPHLEFVPLFFLGYSVMRSPKRIKAFLIILIAVAAINGVVGLVQFGLSPTQLASWGPGYAQKIEGTNGLSPRNFVDSSGPEPRPAVRPWLRRGLRRHHGAAGGTGRIRDPQPCRQPPAEDRRRRVFGRDRAGCRDVAGTSRHRRHGRLDPGVHAARDIVPACLPSRRWPRARLDDRVRGHLGPDVQHELAPVRSLQQHLSRQGRVDTRSPTARTPSENPCRSTWSKYPLGAGIGKVGPASNSAGGTGGKGLNAESEPNYAVLELGIPGLLVLIGFQIRLMVLSIGIRRLKDVELRLLLAALAAPIFAVFAMGWVGITTATTPGSPYLWFVAGILSYWLITLRQQRPRRCSRRRLRATVQRPRLTAPRRG